MRISVLLPLVGVAILLYILSGINLPDTASILLRANPWLILLTISLHVPVLLIKSEKWRILIKSLGGRVRLGNAISAWVVGFFVSMVTPARIGDFSRAYYIRKETAVGKGISSVFVDRLLDVSVLFVFALSGILLASSLALDLGLSPLLSLTAAFFVALILAAFLMTRKGLVRRLVRVPFRLLVPGRLKSRSRDMFTDFYKGVAEIGRKKKRAALSLGFSVLAFSIVIVQYYLLALSIGIDPGILFMFSAMPIVILLDTLPISFSGIGTRDAALVLFFSAIGISAESAISLSLLILFSCYFVLALAGLLLWLRNPIRLDSLFGQSVQE